MSGVTVGTRLEQLLALERKLQLEIRAERIRLATNVAPLPRVQPRRLARVNRVDMRLAALGVSSREVKEWAVRVGLLDAVHRGRVGLQLVEQYATANLEVLEGRARLAECVEEAYA